MACLQSKHGLPSCGTFVHVLVSITQTTACDMLLSCLENASNHAIATPSEYLWCPSPLLGMISKPDQNSVVTESMNINHSLSSAGITLSPQQVERGSSLAAERGLSNASFQVMDAQAMTFPDNTFDLVWACESGEHMPDKQKYIQEMERVLKPGMHMMIMAAYHICPVLLANIMMLSSAAGARIIPAHSAVSSHCLLCCSVLFSQCTCSCRAVSGATAPIQLLMNVAIA